MKNRNISWEIVLAGLAFIIIALYVIDSNSSSVSSAAMVSSEKPPAPPSPPALPSAIVIDLQNLENLKNLRNLDNLKNLKNLENLAASVAEKEIDSQNIEQSLRHFERELKKIENTDFKVRLMDRKVYISKDYNVGVGAWTEASAGVYVYRQTIDIKGIETLSLKLGFGNVNIVGSSNGEAELTLRSTGNIRDTGELSDLIAIRKNISGKRADFEIGSSGQNDAESTINLEATLSIPENLNLQAATSAGHINASNLKGTQELISRGGHITIQSVEGSTTVKTSGGHISGNEISGNISMHTEGGHIKISEARGEIEAKTGGGHIEIAELTGRVSAITGGGNIDATILEADGPLNFQTSAGTIFITLPSAIEADIQAAGNTIQLSDLFKFEGTRKNGELNGKINGGGIPIVIDCGYGNIRINPHE